MKKIIIGFAVAMLAVVANAEFLYWGISDNESIAANTTYNSAKLFAYNDNTAAVAIDSIYKAPGSSSADITNYGEGYSYYIELYNYENGNWGSSVASNQSDPFTYSALLEKGAITASDVLAQANVAAMMMTPHGVQATPEPTSGLLLLMGFAMLGLKRKKEV